MVVVFFVVFYFYINLLVSGFLNDRLSSEESRLRSDKRDEEEPPTS